MTTRKIQDIDFATAAQITGAGGVISQLLNTSRIYDSTNAQLLDTTLAAKVNTSRTISTTGPLTGGGALTSNLTISMPVSTNSVDGYLSAADHTTFAAKQSALTFANSLQNIAGTVNLVGDSTSPGNSFYYGTNSGGTKGFFVLPSPGTGTVTSVALSVPAASIFSVSGSPVTTSGTLAIATAGTSGGIPYFSSTSALSSSALLTANALVLGGGAGAAPASMGSLGTTTTVLHGNAAGAPTFGAVSLTADVSGTLPVTAGGTNNTTFTAYSVITAGTTATGAFQNVSGVGTSGQVLTSNGAAALPTWQAGGGGSSNQNYYSGFSTGATWSTTSATFVDATVAGTQTVTQRIASGLTVTAAASNVAGLTITPSSVTAVYEISADVQLRASLAGNNAAIRLYDGTNTISTTGMQASTTVATPATIYGLWKPGTTSASTIKIQLAQAGGVTATMGDTTGGLANNIEWTMVQITS